MAGHSKWNNIKRKKEKTDAQRGKIFTKIGREIAVAVREGGADANSNNRLRDVIAKAKANNMPNDNILRSIKKASGEGGNVNYEEITYEGYAPGGMAVIVQAMTDNRNRTASDIRYIFDRWGGSLGATNCVAWMFDRKGILVIEKSDKVDEDELMMEALEAGAEDFSAEEDLYEITTAATDFSAVREALEAKGYAFLSAELDMIPQNTVSVTDEEDLKKIRTMLDLFDDHDDVQDVYHNGELPDEEDDED